ncbi:MAG: MazF family transcriptional regulator [Desulfuromonadaceae bacterium GWB2_53_15]|nr:MAG: MazF family transcriptional regulator [Desulfuromonadaceae bacterium GWB2_53_15]
MVEMMRRGEIWAANLNSGRGREIAKIRPVLVMQDNALTQSGTPMVVILPLTTQVYPSFKRWRIMIEPRDRLLKPCQVVVDQPRALDKERFGEGPLTTLTSKEMTAVEHSLKGVLGLL